MNGKIKNNHKTNNFNEGYIKFDCNFSKINCIGKNDIIELNHYRQKLYQLGMIGKDSGNISFGNLSQRINSRQFIITGTNTGGIKNLKCEHYSEIIDWNIDNNSVLCEGLIKASSESLSHAAIYEILPEINSVIHIHNKIFWNKFVGKLPTTKFSAAYGTVELAKEIQLLIKNSLAQKEKIIIMEGHVDGIILFGKTFNDAFNRLMRKVKDNIR